MQLADFDYHLPEERIAQEALADRAASRMLVVHRAEGRWEDRHRLVNFYASDDLRAWIEEEMRRTGKSKTQVIVDALEAQRRKPRGPRPR